MKTWCAGAILIASFSVQAAPQMIAHRGGTGDAPENTLLAIQTALDNHTQAVWITVQLSKDGIPVLYRPSDLSALTGVIGKVSQYNAQELEKINAGWKWHQDRETLQKTETMIPSLEHVLKKWPDTFFYIDIKSPDADPQHMATALLKVLRKTNSLAKIRVYSTEDRYINALSAAIPHFATRSETRTVLVNVLLSHQCALPSEKSERWYGMELNRKVNVVEKFTLGEGVSPATLTWDKQAIDCFRSKGNSRIILFGINNVNDYRKAVELGADGVLIDSPSQAKQWSVK